MTFFHKLIRLAMVCLYISGVQVACAAHKNSASIDGPTLSNKKIPMKNNAPDSSDQRTPDWSYTADDRALAVRRKAPIYAQSTQSPRFALIIGNSKYRNIPALLNPGNDALDMKKKLERLGFKVTYLQDARNRRVMTEAVRQLGNDLTQNKDAVGLFFYAGHAMQINGVNYLIPVDAIIKGEADVEFETLNVNYLLQTMDYAENGMNIIIMDACRNNPYARGFRSVMDRGLAPMDSPTGSIIVFATAPGKTAADGDGRNGIYTKHLLEFIDKPDLTIEQMLKKVRIGVIDETEGSQTPWETSSLRGDFCFAGCREKRALEKEMLQKMEAEIQNRLEVERQRLDKERAQIESQRIEIEAKKLEMKIKAAEAQQRRDREALEKIRKEQGSLSEQRLLILKEQDRIDQQKEVLTDQSTSTSQKEREIARLKEEREKFESERTELEQLRAETEAVRRRIEAARKARVDDEQEDTPAQTVTPMIGF